ncbi:hypothetical protein TNCV_3161061 [Trichonephila clavipes]|nr:hypothetical protein TNCV_3161061 [Trichonephila clavipes]
MVVNDANMVANDAKMVSKVANLVTENDANFALSPRFHQVLIESPLKPMLAKNFKKYFLDEDNLVASYEWIRGLFQDTPEGLSTTEEEIFIDFTPSEKLKVPCLNYGGGDRWCRPLFRTDREFCRSNSYCYLYGAQGQRQTYFLVPCHDEFRGPRSD